MLFRSNASQSASDSKMCRISVCARNLNISEGSHLKLAKGRYVKVSVQDTGHGIPRENISKIFDPFFTTKENGSGLGLPTCFSIMQKHNGAIEVENTSESGTLFSIYIPASADSSEKEKGLSGSDSAFNGIGKRVLVMDDEMYVRDVLGSMLEQLGFEVDKAGDGAEAVMKIASANEKDGGYFAVFFDLTVQGGMGGETAVAKVREFDKDTPVIAASGYSDDERSEERRVGKECRYRW